MLLFIQYYYKDFNLSILTRKFQNRQNDEIVFIYFFKVDSGISNTWQTPKISIWYYHAHTTFIDVFCDNVPFKNNVVVF